MSTKTDSGTIERLYPETNRWQASVNLLQEIWRDYQTWKTTADDRSFQAGHQPGDWQEAGRILAASIDRQLHVLDAGALEKARLSDTLSKQDVHMVTAIRTRWEREQELMRWRSLAHQTGRDEPDTERG